MKISPDDYARQGLLLFQNPELFARAQLAASAIFRSRDDPAASALASARAVTGFLGLREVSRWTTAALTLDIIDELLDTSDTLKAVRWMLVADRFLAANLPETGPEHALYLWSKARLGAAYLKADELAPLYEKAFAAFERLQLLEPVRKHLLSTVAAEWSAALTLSGHPHRGLDVLGKHPLNQDQERILSEMPAPDAASIIFATAKLLAERSSDQPSDPRWLGYLQKGRTLASTDLQDERQYLDFPSALLVSATDPARAGEHFRAAARHRLDRLFTYYSERQNGFPLVSIWDRAVLSLGVASAGAAGVDLDLIVQGTDVLDRSLLSALSDATEILSRQSNPDGRRTAHAWLQVTDQRSLWEIEQLRRILASHGDSESTEDEKRDNIRRLHAHAAMVDEQERLRGHIASHQPKDRTAPFPTAAEIQAALQPGEALLRVDWVQGHILRYCITPTRRQAIFDTGDQRSFLIAQKLVTNALTATHAPDAALDRQYPVAQARELWRSVSRGLDDCLNDSHTLNVSLPGPLRGLPVAALLQSEPNADGGGWALGDARWVGQRWAIAYAGSPQKFVSVRRLATRSGGDLPLLSVGDPVLSASSDAAPAGSRLEALQSMGELPATRDELKALAGAFPKQATLLTREKATEGDVRAQSLSRFNVIHFATHALIRDEVPGLTEAGLVLTPAPAGDHLDDGLLTTNEIASLNLNARLVILSACNTANLDPALFGSQVHGLTAAFALAGAPTLIASLWAVDDLAAQRIMAIFADELRENRTGGTSLLLLRTMQRFMREVPGGPYHHPRFWAPFIVLGDGTAPVASPTKSTLGLDDDVVDDDRPGEIIDAAYAGATLFTSAIGPYDATLRRRSSIVAARTTAGVPLWAAVDRAIGAGPVIAARRQVIAGGYVDSPPVPVLRGFDNETGALRWTTILAGYRGHVASGLLERADGTITAVLEPIAPDAPGASVSLPLVTVTAAGQEHAHHRLMLPRGLRLHGTSVRPALIDAPGGDLLLTVNAEESSPMRAGARPSPLGLPAPCPQRRVSLFYRLEPRKLSAKRVARVDDLTTLSVSVTPDGTVRAAGELVVSCELQGQAVVMSVEQSGRSRVEWLDRSALRSTAVAAFVAPAQMLIVSVSDRQHAVRTGRSSGAGPDNNARRLGDEETSFKEAMLVLNDASGEVDRGFVGSGYSIAAQRALHVNGRVFIFGTRSGLPWMAAVTAPR